SGKVAPRQMTISAPQQTALYTPNFVFILKRYGYAYDPAGNRTVEQIDDVPFKASYNNLNRLLSQDPGGITRFAGTLSEAAKVTIQSKPATVGADNKFSGTATLAGGTNPVDR